LWGHGMYILRVIIISLSLMFVRHICKLCSGVLLFALVLNLSHSSAIRVEKCAAVGKKVWTRLNAGKQLVISPHTPAWHSDSLLLGGRQ